MLMAVALEAMELDRSGGDGVGLHATNILVAKLWLRVDFPIIKNAEFFVMSGKI